MAVEAVEKTLEWKISELQKTLEPQRKFFFFLGKQLLLIDHHLHLLNLSLLQNLSARPFFERVFN
jgi:hypothetical protein